DTIRHAGRLRTIEHDADRAGRPAGGLPLQLDGDEADAQTGMVDLVARERQAMERQARAVRLELRCSPEGHRDTHQNQLRERRSRGLSCGALVLVWDSSGPP